ncbi:MAG: alpha/beta fold hydrolase [Planctomycetota bacterium]
MMSSADADWKRLYPFASNFFQIEPSVRMHYVDEHPKAEHPKADRATGAIRGTEPCIVAVHGNPTWSFYYRSIIREFSQTHRVLSVDHIGCGLSDKPQRYDYCLAQHTDNLVRWIDALDLDRIVMVVHDWGGAIGLGAAIKRLDRIAGLVVLNTGAFPPPYVPLRIAACRLPILGSFAMRYLNAFAKAATRMAIDRLDRLDPSVQAGLLAPYDSPANRVGIDRFVQDIPLSPRHRTYRVLSELEQDLPKLGHLPIRLVWGMKDWCFRPECLRRFEAVWPQAISHELSDVGHYVMEEAPDEVLGVLRKLVG